MDSQPTPRAATERVRTLTPGELAWVALIPCALATLAAIVLLGPPLAQILFQAGSDALWPPGWWEARGRPEPVKHASYLLALLGPLLLATVVLAGARRGVRLQPRVVRALVVTGHGLLLAFVIVAVLGQRELIVIGRLDVPLQPIFSIGTLAAAAALVVVSVVVLQQRRAAVAALVARETTVRRAACLALAGLVTALWLLETVTTDGLVEDQGQMNWTLNDAFAVLNGRTPLVDYHLLYGKLVPYPAALALKLFGTTAFVYTLFLTILSALALMAVYAVFRRVARSSLLALGLFVPFVALTGLRHMMIMAGMWPMRYGGAYAVAWLTARHIDARGERWGAWVIFFIGGLAAINSMEFGLGALAASIAALLCARPPRSRREVVQLGGAVVGGVAGAVVVVCAGTLLHAGALPNPALLMEWPRIFTTLGWFSLPVPGASLHLVVYATFTAAIAVAAVRVARDADDALLSGMLMWSGVFGLVAGSYYVGRAEDLKLLSMFSAWGFALVLLTLVCVRALAAGERRRPTIPQLLVLLGFAIAVCSVVQMPSPVVQLERLTRATPPLAYRPAAERFVRDRTLPGEKVAILLPLGHRIAHNLGRENVSPFGFSNAIVTTSQMRTLIDALQDEGVTEVFLPSPSLHLAGEGNSAPEHVQLLEREGYPAVAEEGGIVELRRG